MEQLYYAVDVGNVEVRRKPPHAAAYAMVNKDYTEERMKSAFVELLTGVHNKLMQRSYRAAVPHEGILGSDCGDIPPAHSL